MTGSLTAAYDRRHFVPQDERAQAARFGRRERRDDMANPCATAAETG